MSKVPYPSDSLVKVRLVSLLMDHAYRNAAKLKQKTFTGLLLENGKMLKNYQPAFRFRGELHGALPPGFRGLVNKLAPQLHDPMEEHLRTSAALHTEWEMVRGYLTLILLETTLHSDLFALTPQAMHPIIAKVVPQTSYQDSIGEERIAALLEKNGKYLEMLRSRLVYELITTV